VDDSNRKDFERAGSGPFRPYGDERETMGYYNVPVSVLEDADELARWGRQSLAVAMARRTVAPRKGARAQTRRRR
jgi:DNA transformation protein